MQPSLTANAKEFQSIDLPGNNVIIITAFNHIIDLLHKEAFSDDSLNPAPTKPFQ